MFRVGDKVKLNKEIYNGMPNFRNGVVPQMVEIAKKHKEFTIAKVFDRGTVLIKEDGEIYSWDSKYFTHIKKENIKVSELKVGDKIKIIKAECGAYGANNEVAIVTDKFSKHGLGNNKKGLKVELVKGKSVWNIGTEIEFELLEKAKVKKEIKDIKIVIHGDETISIIDDKVGKAKRNNIDVADDKIGIIISTMRALNFDKEKIDGVVDVLFDDVPKELKDYSTKELMEEVTRRF